MSDYVSMPPAWLRLCFPVLSVVLFFGLITVFHGQDSFARPRYSDVQESIYSAKKNALRVRTDDNRQEFLSILGDVESALNAARQSVGQSRKQQVLEKLQRIQPEARKALVDAGTRQTNSVRKIKSVTIRKAEATAIEKSIVRKLEPGEKPGRSFATKINPLRWFGRNRQYTKVVERASSPPKPDAWKETPDQPKMVRVPPIPLNLPPVATWSPPPVLSNTLVPDKQLQPSRPPASTSSIPTPTPGVRKIKKRQKPHSSISIQQRSASRRISERTRDGDYRLPSGRVSKTTIPSTLTKKIKKPERKSTKVWDFGPKDIETNHPEQEVPVVEWTPPSRPAPATIPDSLVKPVVPEVLKEVMQSASRREGKPGRFGNSLRRLPTSRLFRSNKPAKTKPKPAAEENPVAVLKPTNRQFVTPKPIEKISPIKEVPKFRQVDKPKAKPVTSVESHKFVTPGVIEKISPIKEGTRVPQVEKPKTKSTTLEGSAVSKVIIVDTLAEKKEKPVPPSTVKKIDTPVSTSKPNEPPEPEDVPVKVSPVKTVSGAGTSTIEQVEEFTQAMRREEEILNERLKGIDKLLSDNAGVLSEAEALLKELEQLEADQKASARNEKPKSPSRLRIRKPSRSTPSPKVGLPSKSDESKDKQPSANLLEIEETKQDLPAESVPPKKKWGTTRRPGIRR